MVGALISAAGYVLAIAGSWILFQNAPPEPTTGTIPRIKGSEAASYFAGQQQAAELRQGWNRRGFRIVMFGTTLQLIGTLVSAFWVPPR